MSEIVKILMEFVKGRRVNSDLLYRWLACAAAMLTIAACIRHQRPSDVLVEVMRISGFDSASAWLATSLPPALALPNQTAQQIVLLIAEILVLAMLFLPFVVAQQEKRPVGWQAKGLLGRELRALSGYFSWSPHSCGHLTGLLSGRFRLGFFLS